MIDPQDWKPDKPQCIHHNDADNCYSCGTGRVSRGYNANLDSKGNPRIPRYRLRCREHDAVEPCLQCQFAAVVAEEREELRLREVTAINAINERIWQEIVEAERAKELNRKCAHGVPLWEHYHGICSILAVEPDYNPEKYRREINIALKDVWIADQDGTDEKDLKQVVDIEIWKASRHYGDKMNEQLAYTVAKNTVSTFQIKRIEETTTEDGTPCFLSFNEPAVIDGQEQKDGTSAAEIEITQRDLQEKVAAPDAADTLEDHREALEALVRTWVPGEKRKVAEAMLRPNFTVWGVPGVSKSQAQRLYVVVSKVFRTYIAKSSKKLGQSGRFPTYK